MLFESGTCIARKTRPDETGIEVHVINYIRTCEMEAEDVPQSLAQLGSATSVSLQLHARRTCTQVKLLQKQPRRTIFGDFEGPESSCL